MIIMFFGEKFLGFIGIFQAAWIIFNQLQAQTQAQAFKENPFASYSQEPMCVCVRFHISFCMVEYVPYPIQRLS